MVVVLVEMVAIIENLGNCKLLLVAIAIVVQVVIVVVVIVVVTIGQLQVGRIRSGSRSSSSSDRKVGKLRVGSNHRELGKL